VKADGILFQFGAHFPNLPGGEFKRSDTLGEALKALQSANFFQKAMLFNFFQKAMLFEKDSLVLRVAAGTLPSS
jgi:hypothetical protein